MNVAIDFDGVIASTGDQKFDWLRKHKGLDYSSHSSDKTSLLKLISANDYSDLQNSTGYEDTLLAQAIPGAISHLKALSSSHKIIVLTSRTPEKLDWAEQWLSTNFKNNEISEVIGCFGKEKARIASIYGCKVLIDNDIRHLLQPYPNIRFLYFCPRLKNEETIPVGIEIVQSWNELTRKIQN